MKKLWLAAAMAASVAALQLPASAAPVNGIPAPGPHGVHGIIIHHCRYHRCCPPRSGRPCGPRGIIIGRPIGRHPIGIRPPVGRPIGVRPIGVQTHGVPVDRTHGGLVNGIPAEQHVQH